MRSCSHSPIECPEIKPQIIQIDTTWLKREDSIVYKPGVKIIIPGKIEYKDVDTTLILKDYFSKIVSEDTIWIDTLGYVLIRDTISQNRIQDRTKILKFEIPVITKTITNNITPLPKSSLYIGFDIMGNKQEPINYFGAALTLKTKKDQLYNGGVGLTPNGMGFKIGTSWPIRIKHNSPR